MGPRPPDFNEELVRMAPTYKKWERLQPGERLSYACRSFVKGGIEDEERLMRRIMIARRNNVKDHATLKKARAAEAEKRGVVPVKDVSKRKDPTKDIEFPTMGDGVTDDLELLPRPPSPSNPSGTKRRRVAGTLQPTDEEILLEMDIPAVEATRSYRKWFDIENGTRFTYNQTYVKGLQGHDWLLKKNIWRRMRYRRENQMKVRELAGEELDPKSHWNDAWKTEMSTDDVAMAEGDGALADREEEGGCLVSKAVADAAAAAAAQVAFEPGIDADAVAALGADDPIVSCALDAAAQLAAAAVADAPTAAELEEHVITAPSAELDDNVMAAATAQLEVNVMTAPTAELEENAMAVATAELYGNAMAAAAAAEIEENIMAESGAGFSSNDHLEESAEDYDDVEQVQVTIAL